MTGPARTPSGASASGLTLDSKLTGLLGGRTAGAFEKAFGIATAGDLLSHYPRRYARRGELTAISKLPLDENVTIVAEVRDVKERQMRARRGSLTEVSISDGEGIITLTFFNQAWRARELRPGVRGIFAGKVSNYRGALQLAHPNYELFDELGAAAGADGLVDPSALDDAEARRWAEMPIPIYPATSTLQSWQIANSVSLVLDALRGSVPDPVPAELRDEQGILPLGRAYEQIHRPQKDGEWMRARDTLRFHEAFVLQSALVSQRRAAHAVKTAPRVPKPGGYLERFDAALPFRLTADQQLVGSEIARDLAGDIPMMRLLQGEVGSGKTLVAVRAMLAVADSGGQSALLAPTEVLASQHLRSIVKVLGPDLAAELMPTLHTGQLSTAERKKALLRMVSGQAKLVVGTHALLSEKVQFYDLGLVVVDEQHRFGVEQRDTLRQKGATPPHVLVMTATPIPRTVAMTVFGDLDVSTISELPAGRQGIESFSVPLAEKPGWGPRIWQRVAEELEQGRQAFVVCPAIDPADPVEPADPADGEESSEPAEGDGLAAPAKANVVDTLAQLRAMPLLAGRRIEALHGRMPSDEKDAVMRAFAAGEIDVLVATTVIEVGVDVPNASTMVVLDADRFGVSQLHQLRGRVGRGGVPGLCLLVSRAEAESVARQRVDAVASTLDGFELAEVDLELRREGDVLGSTQSGGRSSLRLLRVVKDADLIQEARAAAFAVVGDDPGLDEHPALRDALERRLRESERSFLAKT
ncbi:ATP-dependent DNA helicase RecG [Herbiconiux sp. KACC 21604]|uniref:ATP-dependent DNA helicase RecG n=1 Tax=unclassified Herbiconiux TaxID=2618217 RepID=UPI001491D69E|nr:ATP-dependent DNA helicase RecG [Herbiconiux sp. SALV-R1]QJU54075.1 ATP-dependent DNA helicase RecG [Herbiconiux sp. SALV-R1]WPO85119.1 ATP-dependent DNA helicase RecG [Herbiconiux sp. KACC 21604]